MQANGGLKPRARFRPVVLDRIELAEVVRHFGGFRIQPLALLELYPSRVEAADDHQVAPENLVGVGVVDVDVERLRQRLDGFPDLALPVKTVAERIPRPG